MLLKSNNEKVIFNCHNSEEKRQIIDRQLFEFNRSQSAQIIKCDRLKTASPTFIEIYAEVETKKLVGGLISYIDWGQWLYIDTVWVDTNYRKQGIGQYLVTSAEQQAQNKGIERVRLYTFDFQALPFYQKLGYTIYGELADFPEGHTAYYLKKILS